MCPSWIPDVIKDLTAAKFWASPTEAIMHIRSLEDGLSKICNESFTSGCRSVIPPTVPTDKGILRLNLNLLPEIEHSDKLWYLEFDDA